MRILAEARAGDPPLVGGESGVAGLAGLITCASDAEARQSIDLGADARVLIIGSEGSNR